MNLETFNNIWKENDTNTINISEMDDNRLISGKDI